ncbi:glycosyltransferase family 2 protein [Psychroflexus tropicus]|uniref:glycosyltransferase family 2 protein n=1 Tax=Psychroflexus tropicus TaxID=197345 RepID=UPI000370A996|nr:glycosyltransferase family 2 protein [Psychroflexus tropicus]
MPKISALIITLNEANNIGFLIENLSFADEIIVVDSYSEDKTVSIAESYPNVKVFLKQFTDFTTQRNFALEKANHEWILFMDADERLTDPLIAEIQATVNQNSTADAYYFYRKFMFKGKPLHFSGWQTDKNIRLFKRNKATYTSQRLVHEVLKVEGEVSYLKHKLIHYSYSSYASYKSKMINYAQLKAKELHQKGVKPNAFHYFIKPTYKFLYDFIIRGGFLDGKKGIIICYLNALSVYKRYPYLKQLSKQ